MNNGKIVVHGNVGDTVGYAMRGGEIYIKSNAGYRVGIHMKEYAEKKPVIVIGGKAGDFLGEYMAGGIIIILGLNTREYEDTIGNFCRTGMHGGTIYVRGHFKPYKLGKEVKQVKAEAKDLDLISNYIHKFSQHFTADFHSIMKDKFTKFYAYNKRPYGNLYAY